MRLGLRYCWNKYGCCCGKNVDKSIVGTNIEYCCEKNLGKSLNFIGEVGFKVLLEQM